MSKVLPLRMDKPAPRAQKRHRAQLFGLIALMAVAAVLCGKLFDLKVIEIKGLDGARAASLASQSGLRLGMSVLRVDEAAVRQNLSRLGDVEFVSLKIGYPDRLELNVSARVPFAQIDNYGRLIVTDESGTVINSNVRELLAGMPIVTGLDVEEELTGRRLAAKSPEKLKTALDIIAQLNMNGQSGQISELNVANLDNLYLVSRAGMQIRLQNVDNLETKLTLLSKALPALAGEGNHRGVMDISSGKSVFYTPAAA